MTNSNFSFLSPFSDEKFFQSYFEHQILHIERNDPDYFESLIQLKDIDDALDAMDLHYPDVNMSTKGGKAHQAWLKTNEKYSHLEIDKAELFRHLSNGETLIINSIQKHLPRFKQFLIEFENKWGVVLSANAYITPAQEQGFNWHYDNHDVFIFQLEGNKTWHIVEEEASFLPDANFKSQSPQLTEPEKTKEIVVKKGDTLYLPRGVYHKAVSTDQSSVHITVSVTTVKIYQLFEQFLREARAEKSFRRSVLNKNLSQLDHQEIIQQVKDFSTQYFADLNQQTINQAWNKSISKKATPIYEGSLKSILDLNQLSVESKVSCVKNLNYHVTTGARFITIESGNKKIRYPLFLKGALLQMLDSNNLSLQDLLPLLPEKHLLELAKKLVVEGFIIHDTSIR